MSDYRKFFIKTLGCKVNQYESQAMRELLQRSGFTESLSQEMADIYILNTCTVTDRADKESRHWIGHFHKANPKARIVVTGCYVDGNVEKIKFLPGVFYVLNNREKSRIAEVLSGEPALEGVGSTDAARPFRGRPLKITDFTGHTKAFVKIQDGCENACSYCKVPLVRKALESRSAEDITEEVSCLAEKGFKEIVLTGICLGAWGKDLLPSAIASHFGMAPLNIVDLLKNLKKLPRLFRLRLSSIEPKYVTDELIDFIAASSWICKHLHIPLQSGDDDVLKRMNRPYATAEYKALIDKIRKRVEGIAITTDMLIGFPQESDANFANTVRFIKEIAPARTHIFTFSKREGTPAYDIKDSIAADVLKRRFHTLQAAALSTAYLYRERFLGKVLEVLVETRRDKDTRLLTGYSDNYIRVLFEGPDDLMRGIVPVRISRMNLAHTIGEYEPQVKETA